MTSLTDNCPYITKLLNKLVKLNITAQHMHVDIKKIEKAIYYAKTYHGSQKRDSGEAFYTHPLEVAYMVSDYAFDTDIIVSAILHDTLEDTDLALETLELEFGKIVARNVLDLTRVNKLDGTKTSALEMVDNLFVQKKYDALLIKQFDRLHNMQTLASKSSVKRDKTIKETINIFLSLAAFFETRSIEEKLLELCLHNGLNSESAEGF